MSLNVNRVVSLFAALSLILAVLPSNSVAAQDTGDASVVYDFSGWEDGEEGAALTGEVVAEVANPGDLGPDEPLRFVGTLEHEGDPVEGEEIGYEINGEFETTTTDEAGRFFFPPEGAAPLTLADSGLTDGGESSAIRFTPSVAGEYELTAQLAQTGEGEGQVSRISGDGRVETAVEVSRAVFEPGVSTAFVATGL